MKTAILYAVSSLLLLGTSASVLAEMQMGNNSVASMTPHRPPKRRQSVITTCVELSICATFGSPLTQL